MGASTFTLTPALTTLTSLAGEPVVTDLGIGRPRTDGQASIRLAENHLLPTKRSLKALGDTPAHPKDLNASGSFRAIRG
jgi:hypothetical protein